VTSAACELVLARLVTVENSHDCKGAEDKPKQRDFTLNSKHQW